MNKVEGTKTEIRIKLYALSTCGWCNKVKNLLNELDFAYEFEDVDMLEWDDKALVKDELRNYNPRVSYPTLVINEQAVIGFKKGEILEKLGVEE